MNVGIGANPLLNLARSIPNRIHLGQEPPIVPILPAQRKSQFPGFILFPGFRDERHHPVYMLGVMYLLPTPAHRLFQGSARVLVPTIVVPVYVASVIGHPSQLRDRVDHGQKLVLAFGNALVVGNVGNKNIQAPRCRLSPSLVPAIRHLGKVFYGFCPASLHAALVKIVERRFQQRREGFPHTAPGDFIPGQGAPVGGFAIQMQDVPVEIDGDIGIRHAFNGFLVKTFQCSKGRVRPCWLRYFRFASVG